VTVSDIDPVRVTDLAVELGVGIIGPDLAHQVPCDLLSPCALGAGLRAVTIPELACRAVVGAANNQLAEPDDAARLAAAGVLYAPDFVVNAGGVINIAEELGPGGYDPARARVAVERIAGNTTRVLELARDEAITTEAAAERVAERRIEAALIARS
jgi:glutamate dehydrogenase/leucine dehydrogenase